jgi:gas vesicle protein
MDNRKIVAGVLTAIAAGAAVSLILSTKKGKQAGRKLLKRTGDLSSELKGKFSDFVDSMQGKVQGILK